MAKKKPIDEQSKKGPKSINQKIQRDLTLRECFDKGGITPNRASIIAGCKYDYAVKKFKEWGNALVEAEEEGWLERNDRVRKRELESLSILIEKSEADIKVALEQLSENRQYQHIAIEEVIEELDGVPEIRDAVNKMEPKSFMALLGVLSKALGIHRWYGGLVNDNINQLRNARIYNAELHQQYAAIEIMPPPRAVLEAALEKRIAENIEKFPIAIPTQEKKTK